MNYDFSPLVTAIKKNDTNRVDKYSRILFKRMTLYLINSMNASPADAEDCVQDSLLSVIGIIRRDKLRNPKLLYSYVQTSCRNNFLSLQKRKNLSYLEETTYPVFQDAPQMQYLIDQEKKYFFTECLDQLPEENQRFIKYWMDHPDIPAKKVADHFGISVNNAWTRKHRLIKKLHECHKKRINQ